MAMDLEQIVTGRPRRVDRPPVTARVVRTEGGVFASPLGSDQRHPLGPCRGGSGAVVGDVVLLIWTDERPWIAQIDGGS